MSEESPTPSKITTFPSEVISEVLEHLVLLLDDEADDVEGNKSARLVGLEIPRVPSLE